MLDKLTFLIAIVREENFNRAAEACTVTPPTLSAGIRQLEETLGVLSINRTSRYHGLTPERERVLEWAKRLVADARAMRQDVQSLRQGLIGHLRIGAIPTALAMVSSLTNLSRTSTEVRKMLDNLEIDMGLTYLDNEPLGRVRTGPLYAEHYGLLTQPR